MDGGAMMQTPHNTWMSTAKTSDMNDPDKHKIENSIGDAYLALYREALEERDYYKNVSWILSWQVLELLGIKNPSDEKIQDYLDKIGGRKDLW